MRQSRLPEEPGAECLDGGYFLLVLSVAKP